MYRVIENRSQEKNDHGRAHSRVPKSLREKFCKRKMQSQLVEMERTRFAGRKTKRRHSYDTVVGQALPRFDAEDRCAPVSISPQHFPLPRIYNDSCETSPGA